MNIKIAARITAVLALGAAMTAAFLALRGSGSQDASSPRSAHPGGEPAKVELARCRDIGTAAASDESCRKAWADNRRRFLQPSRSVIPYAVPLDGKVQSRLMPLESSTPKRSLEDQSRPNMVAP
ncbi:hypothetical protein CO731_00377 [Aminobacter sp. MSH1]|uniref:putative entry exclusion protein TrbK-alt n=1 Tax=Aminobacter sp. MSH1 TaxID=374606 RepID=UPI000D3D943C|nr:putative entry exclusion protein TrbK-alt [Aminobacter sp. MSH1]AWC20936.1 hypothetical protein CO731_00377 [Aminobacter sp. MSH1]